MAVGALALLAVAPAGAGAITLLTPAEGETTTSTPVFTWAPDRGEDPVLFELTPAPPPVATGEFPAHPELRSTPLDENQARYALPAFDRLFAGTWYWHVGFANDATLTEGWSEVRTLSVADEPAEIGKFGVAYRCPGKISFHFSYADNSLDQAAAFRLEFRKRSGRRVAKYAGAVGASDKGKFSASFDRPRRLKPTRRYGAQLVLTDPGGNVTRSPEKKVRIKRCARG